MLTRVHAIEFVRRSINGKTKPAVVICENDDGNTIETLAKFSAGPERGTASLAVELVAACLAGDLGLPIPEPYLVECSPDWITTVPADFRGHVQASCNVAFGSKLITGQLAAWNRDTPISDPMVSTAAAVFAFDAWIDNIDRRDGNPNCIVRGDEIRIFDHDLAFPPGPILGKQPPWVIGSLRHLEEPGKHIFWSGLRGRVVDYAAIRDRWSALSDARLSEYGLCLPAEWAPSRGVVDAAQASIRSVRDNIEGCIAEMQRVLA